MPELNDQIEKLQFRLDKMVEYQNYFDRETKLIRVEIEKLKKNDEKSGDQLSDNFSQKPSTDKNTSFYIPPAKLTNTPIAEPVRTVNQTYKSPNFTRENIAEKPVNEPAGEFQTANVSSGWEDFIGRNLISLIGIIITILGVGIGAKYAIDRDLISPAARIVLGYLFAFGVFGTGFRLKSKYLDFSAVLMSGALAMMYFLTYFAYDFYELIPQKIAFLMMLCITALTVLAAINFNRQIIAHIGLVGAYAVPFLLGNHSGRYDILFGYMTIVNFGILLVSVKKFWKPLYYTSFIFTWLIFSGWYFSGYHAAQDFPTAFGFLTVFFLTFYLTFISYKLIADEDFNAEIVGLILLDSFIFYGFGSLMINNNPSVSQYLGLFTVINAGFHGLIAFVVHKYRLGGRINLYLPVGIALAFLTIAVPVQFDGQWITLLWTAEALFLFVFGRLKRLTMIEVFSFPLMFLATASLLVTLIENKPVAVPLLNGAFLTSIIFAAACAMVWYVNEIEQEENSTAANWQMYVKYIASTVCLLVFYNSFRTEIGHYFHNQTIMTAAENNSHPFSDYPTVTDSSLSLFNTVWSINYTMFFVSLLAIANIKQFKSEIFGVISLGLNSSILFIFLTAGLLAIGQLRDNYLNRTDAELFARGTNHLIIRYISYFFAAGLIASIYAVCRQDFIRKYSPDLNFGKTFDTIFYPAVLWLTSSELLNWMSIYAVEDSYKLGLSILWGFYALTLVVIGIAKRKKHLRLGAIVLFAVTLAKLFFYDITSLGTISKTVVFISLGIILLIVSFLYTKYKSLILDENDKFI